MVEDRKLESQSRARDGLPIGFPFAIDAELDAGREIASVGAQLKSVGRNSQLALRGGEVQSLANAQRLQVVGRSLFFGQWWKHFRSLPMGVFSPGTEQPVEIGRASCRERV